jgi:hypothetical protein
VGAPCSGLGDVVPLGFDLECEPEQPFKLPVVAAAPQRGFDVDLSVREQARPDFAVGGEAETPAGSAKVLADRADESDNTPRTGNLIIVGRPR